MKGSSLFSVPCPAFIACRFFFSDGHSDQCEVVPRCSFGFHFSHRKKWLCVMLSIFSCVCELSVCLLWGNVCLDLPPIFWLYCVFVCLQLILAPFYLTRRGGWRREEGRSLREEEKWLEWVRGSGWVRYLWGQEPGVLQASPSWWHTSLVAPGWACSSDIPLDVILLSRKGSLASGKSLIHRLGVEFPTSPFSLCLLVVPRDSWGSFSTSKTSINSTVIFFPPLFNVTSQFYALHFKYSFKANCLVSEASWASE